MGAAAAREAASLYGMEVQPDDVVARRARLERWVAKQKRRRDPDPVWGRLARNVTTGKRVARSSKWFADHVLYRGLDRSARDEPEHDHPDRTWYATSPWYALPRALRYVGVSDRDTFVDFGCGKGIVVHQAAKRPFRRVIGVEISPVLAEIARANLAGRTHQHRCQNVEIVVSDVTEFSVPDDLTIAYLFHPFMNETLDAALRGIIDSVDRRPRRVRLIYVCPNQSPQVLATGRFRLLKVQNNSFLDPYSSPPRTEIFESC
jgi:SAM-dependent methyltransferase